MPILGFLLPFLGNFRVPIVIGLLFWALGTYALYERGEAAIAHLDTFKAQIEAVSAQAILRNKEIEHANKSRITVALSDRDTQLARLRKLVQENNARGSVLPRDTGTAADASKICFDKRGLDDALKQFIGEAAGIAEAGDGALIDNKAWLKAWPK